MVGRQTFCRWKSRPDPTLAPRPGVRSVSWRVRPSMPLTSLANKWRNCNIRKGRSRTGLWLSTEVWGTLVPNHRCHCNAPWSPLLRFDSVLDICGFCLCECSVVHDGSRKSLPSSLPHTTKIDVLVLDSIWKSLEKFSINKVFSFRVPSESSFYVNPKVWHHTVFKLNTLM